MANRSRYDGPTLSLPNGVGHPCWSCRGLVTGGAFCPVCQVIQPPDLAVDFFQLFDLPKGFSLERTLLDVRYQALQRQFHPDRFATRSATERRFSLEHVTRINQAYQTLLDPLARSGYLLTCLGHLPPRSGQPDPEFLMEVMEQREALDAIDLTAAGAGERLARLRSEAETHIDQELQRLTRLFAAPDAGGMEEIAQANHRLQYRRRFLEALDQAEETLFSDGMS